MLSLLKSCDTGKVYYLLNQKYLVGRKNCDIPIVNDQSISRLHAIIRVRKDNVTIADAGSRYGTFCDDEELRPRIKYTLKHGNTVQFGMFDSKFMFEQHAFISAASRLTVTEKAILKKKLSGIGGQLAGYWDYNCTHLTVKEVGMTVKVLYALASNAPIVTLDYWCEANKKVAAGQQMPEVNMFNSPPLSKSISTQVEWKKNVDRKGLFKEKVFIFLSEDATKMLAGVILKLEGKCLACDKEPAVVEELMKNSSQVVVIQPARKSENETFDRVVRLIKEKKQRLILEQEIALAIFSGCCDKYCNPDHNKVRKVILNINKHVPSCGLQESIHQFKNERYIDEHYDGNDMKKFKSEIIPSTILDCGKSSSLEYKIKVYNSDGSVTFAIPSGGRIVMKNKDLNMPSHKRKVKKNNSICMPVAKTLKNMNYFPNTRHGSGEVQTSKLDSVDLDNSIDSRSKSSISKKSLSIGTINDSEESETDIIDITKAFKNTVKIVPMKVPLKDNADNAQGQISNGKRNFKKFKKTKPLCSRSNAIDNTQLMSVYMRRTASIRAEEVRSTQSQTQIEADQPDRDVVPSFKRGPKKFILTQELCI